MAPPQYSVEYRTERTYPTWQLIPHVVADGLVAEFPHRWFANAEGQRFEVPIEGTEFRFSADRNKAIELDQARQKAAAAEVPK